MPRLASESNAYIPLTPSKVALAVTVDATISASTEVTLNAATTILRVYATTQDVYLKWGTADVTASNFDEICPAGQVVDLVVPIDSTVTPPSRFTAINVIERTTSAAIVIIEK